MSRNIFTVVALLLAGAAFFFYTKPTYDDIQSTQAQIATYNAALDKAAQLEKLKQSLLTKYDSFNPADIDRLQKMLPDSVNNIGLILDLDTLASHYGMSLANVDVGSTDANSQAQSIGEVGASPQKYQSLNVSFSVQGTYENFQQFMNDLQSSLRIVDITGIKVAQNSVPGALQRTYGYDVALRTYWLK